MLEFAKKLAKRGGKLALRYYKDGFSCKIKSNPSDLVTEADVAVSDFIVEEIKKKFPDHGIITEETDGIYNDGAEYTWVIDPIDGTRNFANHIPIWCTMIGITKNDQPYIGVIYDPLHDELFYAKSGEGAFCNGKKINVNDKENLDYSFMVFTSGKSDHQSLYSTPEFIDYKRCLNNLIGEKGRWLHQYGCMIDMCYLSAGRLDVVAKNGMLYHDILAPYVIAKESGAKVTDCFGKDWEKGKKNLVVANQKLHEQIIKLFL